MEMTFSIVARKRIVIWSISFIAFYLFSYLLAVYNALGDIYCPKPSEWGFDEILLFLISCIIIAEVSF